MGKATCELEDLNWHNHLSPIIKQAIKNQQTLDEEFLLQGYLTINWFAAIQENHPDKPELLLTDLYTGIWKTFFASIWEQRNTIAHSNESIITRIERAQLIVELKEWKRFSNTSLASNQQFLIHYNMQKISGGQRLR